jgi:biotin carboxylase
MTGTHSVLILGGRLSLVERAVELGVRVEHVHPADACDERVHKLSDAVTHAALDDAEALNAAADAAVGRARLDRVLSLTEPGLLPAARLNERLGLKGNSLAVVRRFSDKVLMRQHLAAHGVSPVRAVPVATLDQARAFAHSLGGPLVLKPADGAGSVGVEILGGLDELEERWAGFRSRVPGPAIAEEFLAGPEISVEAVSARGRHRVLAVTGKLLTAGVIEAGHSLPLRLEPDVHRGLVALVERFLDVMELWEGPSHTEVILTADGPRIVESHSRIGGAHISELIQLATGVDVVRLSVALPLGLATLPEPVRAPGGAAMRFLLPDPGVVASVAVAPGPADPDGTEIHIEAEPGTVIPPLRSGYDRVAGYVIARGRDEADARLRCEAAAARVRIEVRPPDLNASRPPTTTGGI